MLALFGKYFFSEDPLPFSPSHFFASIIKLFSGTGQIGPPLFTRLFFFFFPFICRGFARIRGGVRGRGAVFPFRQTTPPIIFGALIGNEVLTRTFVLRPVPFVTDGPPPPMAIAPMMAASCSLGKLVRTVRTVKLERPTDFWFPFLPRFRPLTI